MTIILSHADYWKLLNQAEPIQQHGYADEFDITYKHPLAKGYFRQIQIRGCIFLDIYNCQLNQLMIVDCPDRGHWFEVRFSVLADSHLLRIFH
ncbi:hypothetical protein [Nostoc sp.]|uniref:hypothetical protein n=1 Tax=Nostoc sp. TaxID=1180 RepID=UPI002FFABC0D